MKEKLKYSANIYSFTVADSMELGGNIELVGFHELASSDLIVLKKIIGNYVRRFSNHLNEDYESASVHLKKIHGAKSSRYEVHAKVIAKGKQFVSEAVENNIYIGVAEVLKKLESQIEK